MGRIRALARSTGGAAAAELALLLPLMILLMFGTLELGNLFMTQHALSKQVRDGVRYASRLSLAEDYSCPGTVYRDGDATADIIAVTQRGSLDATASGRFNDAAWADGCDGAAVEVALRCVAKGTTYGGMYQELDGDIPVVAVNADMTYRPILANAIGFDNAGICLTASAEAPVIGL